MNAVEFLKSQGACSDAIEWVESHGGTLPQLWKDCERGDWMGWIVGKTKYREPGFYLALADIVEKQSLPIYKKYHSYTKVITDVSDTLRLYAEGRASREDLRKVAYAAYAAAADAAAAAADAADAAAYAADAAAYATAYAAAARSKSLKKSAAIWRKHISAKQLLDFLSL